MSIQSVLNGIIPYSDHSYANFAKVLDKAYVELSFWGSPNVYSVGYSGSISLQELAEKVRALVDFHPEFSEEERKIGKIIQNKVSLLDDIADDQERRVGFIRSCIFTVIEFFTERSSLLYDAMLKADPFDYCTAKQYRKICGKDPKSKPAGKFCEKEVPQKHVLIWQYPNMKNQ